MAHVDLDRVEAGLARQPRRRGKLAGHARRNLALRWPWLLALPLGLAAAGFAQRGLRALADPASVGSQMANDSALNVGSAFSYVPIALAFHAVLLTLVVGRLLAELRWRSRHDGLTGLLNRRSMEELLAEQLQRSRRSAEPFVVLMLDMDHFKAINDRLGHAVGDLALRHAAALLAGALRKVDRLGRFGGEEFIALLPGITLAEAQTVAERLRGQVATTPLAHPGGTAAGVRSMQQGWEAALSGRALEDYATTHPELAAAIEKFGGRA